MSSTVRLRAKDIAQALKDQKGTTQANPLKVIAMSEVKPEKEYTSVARLKVKDVLAYEYNPRQARNEKYDEIKASIIANGLEQQLSVTRRSGKGPYVLARGGKTRLTILQELADEFPERFAEHDFLVVPYQSEARLLASHLVENIQRSDMCWYDTAAGMLKLREEYLNEAGGSLSEKALQEKLKRDGIAAKREYWSYFELTEKLFSGLGPLRSKVSVNDIRHALTGFTDALQRASVEKLTESAFSEKLSQWASTYPSLHVDYDTKAFQDHLIAEAAATLGKPLDELEMLLSLNGQTAQSTSSSLQSELGTEPVDRTANAANDDTSDASGAASETSNADDSETQAPAKPRLSQSIPPAMRSPGLQALSQSLSGASSGMLVARGLTPRKAAGGNDSVADLQSTLPTLSHVSTAYDQFMNCVHEVAETAGIQHLICEANGMRLGYYMELPKEAGVLGTEPDELPITAWWLLAFVAGQIGVDAAGLLEATNTDGSLSIPDNGPEGFRAALQDLELLRAQIQSKLGGIIIDANVVIDLATNQSHPLCEGTCSLLVRMKEYRTVSYTYYKNKQQGGQ
jgi:ParB family protein of integrating conjugative element (PFGI_1 class)